MVAEVFVPVRVRISALFFMYGFSKVLCLNSMQPKSMKYRAEPSPFFLLLNCLFEIGAPKAASIKGKAKKRVWRPHVGRPAECAGALGGKGVDKTADIGMNRALGPARSVPCKQGAAD